MVKKTLFLFLLTSSIIINGSGGWRQVTKATYSQLNEVFFLNENLGWIAGLNSTLLFTTDGGYNWESSSKPLPVEESMYSVFFIDENIGFSGGANDLLLKTIDGGNSWNQITLDSTDGIIYSIYFVNENIGWILSGTSNGGKVSATLDGGVTWDTQVNESSVNLKAMSFSSPNHGICVGSKSGSFAFYYTTDGINWTKSPNPTNIPNVYTNRTDIYALDMASDNVACITGWGSYIGAQPSFTIRTNDGGANWEYQIQAAEDRIYVSMYDITFKDEYVGIAVGGSSYKGGVAYKTIDGGITWKEVFLPIGFQCKSISIVNDKICIVGSGGGIVISDDDGVTWTSITEAPTSTLFTIENIGENIIVAAGFYGVFLKSTDNGKTWHSSYTSDNNVCPTIEDLFFLDENIGYAAQRNRMVSKTVDGGKTWKQIMKDTISTTVNNLGVQFINEEIGFVVGKAANNVSAFYKTLDGGVTWSSLIADPNLTNELNTLFFFDENNGVVAGDESALAYTTDGGTNWIKVTPSNMPPGDFDFNEIEFLNNEFGLAAGERLIKSLDGGKTWDHQEVMDLPGTIEAVEIVDELVWYLTGSKFLLKTEDGGTTWTNIIDLDVVTSTSIYDVTIDSKGHPWLACSLSEIYTTSPRVDVKVVNNNLPMNISLAQNYPNPFNPATVIKYSILNDNKLTSNVTLKVYNLLGQEVATLVNEQQKSGTYEVTFDASKVSAKGNSTLSGLTSGIYIYSLQNNGLLISQKMLLVK